MLAHNARDSSLMRVQITWATVAFAFFSAWIAVFGGMIIEARAGSATVSVLETGGETVLFRFKNQAYRNHFAVLNGEQ
jgi:hypothetical protein